MTDTAQQSSGVHSTAAVSFGKGLSSTYFSFIKGRVFWYSLIILALLAFLFGISESPKRFDTTAGVLRSYVNLLTWPAVVLIAAFIYRDVIRSLLPGAKVKLTISGVEFETTLPIIEQSIRETLYGEDFQNEQWDWLAKLHDHGPTKKSQQDNRFLRPLRNAGLIRTYPSKSALYTAPEVEITTLGRLLVDARRRK
jgi:hypothetical protein